MALNDTRVGKPAHLTALVDVVDGIEWRASGVRTDGVTLHGNHATYCGRIYACEDRAFPFTDGKFVLKPHKRGVCLTICKNGACILADASRIVEPDEMPATVSGRLNVRLNGHLYACPVGGYPAPGDYPLERVKESKAEPVRESGVDASAWWAETKERMYSPEMCEAYRLSLIHI